MSIKDNFVDEYDNEELRMLVEGLLNEINGCIN
jgi:hypothetical protein